MNLLFRIFRKLKKIFIITPYEFIQAQIFIHTINKEKNVNDYIIVLSDLIGDTVYGLSYLTAIHKNYPDKKIIVIGNKKQKELIESYKGIDKLILLENKKWINRKNAFMHSSVISEKALQMGIYNSNPFFIKKCYNSTENPDILYQLKKSVYQIPIDSTIDYHNMVKSDEVKAIPNFAKIKDKVIVMNPYSKSLSEFTMALYENICTYLIENGYIVYTNVVGTQKAINGSYELCCSIEELYMIASKIPAIISVRSGILDFLAPSKANMFVIYENCHERLKRMYHLVNWQISSVIHEIYCEDSKSENDIILNELKTFLEEIKQQ